MDEKGSKIETTEARRRTGNTAAKRTLRKPNGEAVAVKQKELRAIAVHNAICPNCGISNAANMHKFPKPLIRRTGARDAIVHVHCDACDTGFKVSTE